MTQKPINDVIDTSKELLRDIDLSKLPESIINLLVRLREALTAYVQDEGLRVVNCFCTERKALL